MQQNDTFQGTIKIRQSLGDETVIKDAEGYAWHGEHGVLEVVQEHGHRVRFFPVANIREVVVLPETTATSASLRDTPGKQYWTTCPGCGKSKLYYRKQAGDFRCTNCKKVFEKETVENAKA